VVAQAFRCVESRSLQFALIRAVASPKQAV